MNICLCHCPCEELTPAPECVDCETGHHFEELEGPALSERDGA